MMILVEVASLSRPLTPAATCKSGIDGGPTPLRRMNCLLRGVGIDDDASELVSSSMLTCTSAVRMYVADHTESATPGRWWLGVTLGVTVLYVL